MSPVAKARLGYEDEEIVDLEAWRALVDPDDLIANEAAREAYFASEAPEFRSEFRVRAKDGSTHWILARGIAEYDHAGRPLTLRGTHTDITDIRRAQAALDAREAEFRRVTDAMPILIGYIDRDLVYRFNNQAYEDWFGMARSDITGRRVDDIVEHETFEKNRSYIEAALAGRSQTCEYTISLPDGDSRRAVSNYLPDRDADGKVRGFYVATIDVTDRYVIEGALRRTEERYAAAVEASRVGVWERDLVTDRIYLSPQAKARLGYGENEIVDFASWCEVIHPDDRDATVATSVAHIADEKPVYEFEYRVRTKSGETRWILSRGVVERDDAGAPVTLRGTHTDITEIKHAEQALRDGEARLRAVFDAADAAIVLLDRTGAVLTSNDRYAAQFAKRVDEIVGKRTYQWVPGSAGQQRYTHLSKVVESGQPQSFEIAAEGVHTEHTQMPVTDVDGNVVAVAAFIRDVTARHRVEAEVRQARDAAERANAAKTRFFAAASHDMRQPLQAARMFVDLLRTKTADSELAGLVERVERSLESSTQMLDTLLDIWQLDARNVPVETTEFVVAPLLSRLAEEFAPAAASKGVVLRQVACGATVRTDPALLERLLRNLVANAVRYTETGRIVLGCRRTASDVRIEIWDTGVGMSEPDFDRVFEEDYQVGNPARDRRLGLGLGLAIVRRLADLLELVLAVRSEPGRGTVFTVTVPRSTTLERPTVAASRPRSATTSHAGTVIVIDDEPDVLDALRMTLQAFGYQVIAAESTATAQIALRRGAPPDAPVILADYRLQGGETGRDTIACLRAELGVDVPGVLLTGDASPERRAEAHANGLRLLAKPVDPRTLNATLHDCLN